MNNVLDLTKGIAWSADFQTLKENGWTVAQIARTLKLTERATRRKLHTTEKTAFVKPCHIIIDCEPHCRGGHNCTSSTLYKAIANGKKTPTAEDRRQTSRKQFIDREKKKGTPDWLIEYHLKHLQF